MKALAALLVVLLACVAAGGAGAQQRHLRVLFVGNSLTATNDLPATVAAIARGVGHTAIDVQTVAPGGYALEDHWADGSRAGRAAYGPLRRDRAAARVVVAAREPRQPDRVDEALGRRSSRARYAAGGLTVWPERERFSVFADVVRNPRRRAGGERAAPARGAGVAERVWRRPAIGLYGPDAFHPSRLGTYLAALVAYTGLTGELPRTLPRQAA